MADLTYVRTWSGWVYAAFVIDVFSRWSWAGRLATPPAHRPGPGRPGDGALAPRPRAGDLAGLVHHSDRGVQYLAIRYTERLAEAGAVASVGSRGDSYDNALAESFNGLYKAELIRRRGPWRGIDDVELATLEYLDWFNHRRLHTACNDRPPAEFEAPLLPSPATRSPRAEPN